MREKTDLIVVGGGPAGYVAAIRAAQLGLRVAVVEKESALGGTCLRVGCIPSKALLESSELYHQAGSELGAHGVAVGDVSLDLPTMMKRKTEVVTALVKGVDGLFKKHKIARHVGHGRLTSPTEVVVEGEKGETTLEADRILIATGSRVAPLRGVSLEGDLIGTSTEAIAYEEVPTHLVVIGAGAIGLELGSVWRRLGAEVTVLEYLDRILPGTDGAIAKAAHRVFEKQGLAFHLGAKVTGASVKKKTCTVEVEGKDPITCDRVLVAVGRIPNTEGLGLDAVGIETDDKGRIPVDERYRTKVDTIFAVGDVIEGPMLAHKASEEGIACVERIVTGYGHVNYDAIPNIVYTMPEIAGVGKTEEELKKAGTPYKSGRFPFIASGRARALGHTEGMVKMLAHAETDRLLGVHILGARAGDLIAEAAVAIEFGASAEDVARATHAHPTLAEAVKEAALAVGDRAIHI